MCACMCACAARKCDGVFGMKIHKQREEQLVKPKRDRRGKEENENEIIVCFQRLFFPLPSFE